MQIDRLFLSVGVMKAGTTWIHRMLSQHPQIRSTPVKEIHYFSHLHLPGHADLAPVRKLATATPLTAIDPKKNKPMAVRSRLLWTAKFLAEPTDDRWYANLFAPCPQDAYCADFSNLYCLMGAPGWHHVRRICGKVRVIFTMRDPRTRLWSHARFSALKTGRTAEIATWTPETFETLVRTPSIWMNGEYGSAVRRLRESLSEEELKISFFEDIHRDPARWLREVEDHLGIRRHDYSTDGLTKRFAQSVERPMPDWLPELFQSDLERVVAELAEQGIEAPREWLSPLPTKPAEHESPSRVSSSAWEAMSKARRTVLSAFRA
ncbi:sulfotransferase [Jiella endophytica]|uniref:Sulfotransferase n=1 Tax=Jiella endophytica TaxID=2558362 RepID=A0A4Y8RTY6_9HYPH|nr:sulfotransferase [Jiella endophytica]TFF27646.1 sulfotransferase [Jiella endophytica]